MAHLHNHNYQRQSLWQGNGSKIKTGVEVAGAIKRIWDAGKVIYGGIQASAPIAGALMAAV